MNRKNISNQNKNISRSLLLWETRNRKKKTAAFVCAFLAVLVALATVVQMIRPAVAVTKKEAVLDCGYEVHTHSDDCYRILYDEAGNETGKELICGKADYVIHHHTDECYKTIVHEDEGIEEKVLVCELPEIEAHVHDDSCYEERTELICTEEHEHDESCYETVKVLTCDKPELHTHDETCYDENNVLICGKIELKEHNHSEACMSGSDEFKEEPVQEVSDMSVLYPAQSFEQTAGDLQIKAEASEGTLPADTVMTVQEIGTEEMMETLSSAVDKEIIRTQALDIRFYNSQDMEIEPLMPVSVSVVPVYDTETEIPVIVQVDELGEAVVVENESAETEDGETLVFETDTNTVSAIVYTVKEKIIASDGQNYKITVSYGEETGIPEDAELLVEEINEEYESYAGYIEQSQAVLGIENVSYVRLFDISIVNKYDYSINYQPAVGTAVDVKIELADSSSDHLNVVHFADQEGTAEVVENNTENSETGSAVQFAADGFSVYAIVDAKDPYIVGEPRLVTNLSELNGTDASQGFYLSYQDSNQVNHYFSNSLNNNNCLIETSKYSARWYFEQAGEEEYRIYTLINGEKKYIHTKNGNLIELSNSADTFVLQESTVDNKFYFKKSDENKWLQHSNGGGGIRYWTDNNNTYNSQISITYASSVVVPDDPYELDGKTYGIVYNKESASGAALMADGTGVASQTLIVKHDVLYHTETLLVAQNTDISQWTFENVSGDQYNIYTVTDGIKQYLTINGSTVSLTPQTPDPLKSLITVTPGTGENKGKIRLTVNKYDLNVNAKMAKMPIGNEYVFAGFDGFKGAASETSQYNWMNFAITADNLADEDFAVYTAEKVSVSQMETVVDLDEDGNPVMVQKVDENGSPVFDENDQPVMVPKTHQEYKMPNGAKVVMYTRIWNAEREKYEFFVVDYDGTLLPAYDEGNMIEWTGSQYNTASLNFTEYYNEDGTPNYYYELENYYGKYLVPSENGILSDSPTGINMNGRRFGYDYTPIIAWDSNSFRDWGFEIEDGKVVSRATNQPQQDFYFAIVQLPDSSGDRLTTVDTIDNSVYGITMKMIDFNNKVVGNNRDSVQNAFFTAGGMSEDQAGILSSNLVDGYPSNGENEPLSTLFSGMTDVNHLFIESVHNESGYFEYDSTQNFARLYGNTFTVYDQLGTIDSSNTGPTRTHGQFMPYNDLNVNAQNTTTNQTDIKGNLLSDLDPRKGEKLYPLQGKADHHFGMEMSAPFTQTPSGLDNWGNDIVFEFSGDDDFWLYVDDELVLDLGGIHSAMSGKVNFRTGVVTSDRSLEIWDRENNRFTSKSVYTLREIFETNYRKRNPGAPESEIDAYLAGYFEEGETVFREYTNHTMKIFYMERGAGASNLHMRFNLASVKPGRVILKKNLTGTASKNAAHVKFPYQIWYRTTEGGEPILLQQKKTGQGASGEQTGGDISEYINVFYENTNRQVDYADELEINGKTYNSVFLLKPGESAEIDLPDETIEYRIVECGVDTSVYDEVSANNIVLDGENDDGNHHYDFGINYDTTANRPRVTYDNHVNQETIRSLTITKKLFKEDGETEITDDETTFKFRLYIGDSSESETEIALADRYEYHLKNRDGAYCYWDKGSQRFVPFEPAVTEFSELTDEQKTVATLNTSMYGAVDQIPSGFTVEVPDLLIGTRFRVEERDNEIPDGYSLQQYKLQDSLNSDKPINGSINNGEDLHVEVDNLKGWGVRINKTWSDDDFMKSHEPVYFAVYIDGELQIDKVRQMDSSSSSLYWYFERLALGKTIDNYSIMEVSIEPAPSEDQIDSSGWVTIDENMTVTPRQEGVPFQLDATPKNESGSQSYTYTVDYTTGTVPEGKTVRVDEAVNFRQGGIKLYKTDWHGNPLPGAAFNFKTENGTAVGNTTFKSDEEGFVTTLYLDNDGVYKLSETKVPAGYQGMTGELTLTRVNDSVTVSGDSNYYTYLSDTDGMMRITVRNKEVSLQAVKVDNTENPPVPLEGVVFELHMQAENDQTHEQGMVNRPMDGYEHLESGSDGIIPLINETLPPGTYYLKESSTIPGYTLLGEPLCFTVTDLGIISVNTDNMASWLSETAAEDGTRITYTITIPNEKEKKVSFKKVDIANPGSSALEGARFEMYRVINGEPESSPMINSLISDSEGMLTYGGNTVFTLDNGVYQLVETAAPEGYTKLTQPVTVTVTSTGITYETPDTPNLSLNGGGITHTGDIYTLLIANSSGYELPQTGGIGTIGYQLAGGLLVLLALILKFRKH